MVPSSLFNIYKNWPKFYSDNLIFIDTILVKHGGNFVQSVTLATAASGTGTP